MWADELRRLQENAAELRRVEADLLNVGALSAEERARYDRYLAEREELERNLDAKKKRQTELEVESAALKRKRDEARNQAEQMVAKICQHQITEEKIATARHLGNLFGELKTIHRQTKREALKEAINRHFRVLMTSHRLIERGGPSAWAVCPPA